MRQVHVREPWADLANGSEKQLIDTLMARIELLESRLKALEVRVTDKPKHEQEVLSLGV